MLLYHIADVHIGVTNRWFRNNLFEIQYEYLKTLYDSAEKHKVDFIIIAGDLFDSNSIPSLIAKKVFELMEAYHNVHTIIIPGGGNSHGGEITGHDAYTVDSIYKRPDISLYFESDNLHILTPDNPILTINDTSFYAGFFEIPKYNKTKATHHIGVIHGAFGKNDGEIDPLKLENTFYDYIALGHYHKHRIFGKSAYSGAFIQFEFTKAKDLSSGFIKVSLSPELKIEYIEFPDAPRFLRAQLLSKWDVEELKSTLTEHTFVEIEGYIGELRTEVSKLLKHPNIELAEDAFVLENDSTGEILFSALKKGIYENSDIPEDYREEILSFIMRFIIKKPNFPEVKRYLERKYGL